MKGIPLEHNIALTFIKGGKSKFTFKNTKTENRFTFKVKKSKDSELYFVSVLTNPDVYQYIGTIRGDVFSHGKKSKISQDATSVKVFKYVFTKLVAGNLESFIEVWHEGSCGRCGRTLTDPESIKTGFGPFCRNM